MTCGFVPPTPGYAPCTREVDHSGPCAHPFADMGFFTDAEIEYRQARSKHRPMQSMHEGLAVIWEEFEEFKQEVFKKKPDPQRLREELIQIAAMCRAFDHELLRQQFAAVQNLNEGRQL